MMYKQLGDCLFQYIAEAKFSILLVAPFIKASVIRKLLGIISEEIDLKVITRWIPEEIIAGVSDLEIWRIIQSRPHSSLYLCQHLHAKYYRFDNTCLVGSANLTAQALGWKTQSNLELLLPFSFKENSLIEFEEYIFMKSFMVNDEIYNEYCHLISIMKKESTQIIYVGEYNIKMTDSWLPSLRNPEELYMAYSGRLEYLTTVGKELARKDLMALNIIQGLSLKSFEENVGLYLRQAKIVRVLDDYLDKPRRFGEMRKKVSDFLLRENIDLEPTYVWQILMRWLIHFLPNRYSYKVSNYSEIFYRHYL